MKRIFALIAVFTLAGLVLWQTKKSVESPTPTQKVLGAPTDSASEIVFEGNTFSYSLTKVSDTDELRLTPNFTDPLTTNEILKRDSCTGLVNGGFYTQDHKPTGLFKTDGTIYRKYSKNSLFNGILSVNELGVPRITRTPPKDSTKIALQTGPMLFENGAPLKLNLISDKLARRVIASTTGTNELYFAVIWDPKSAFGGPYLKSAPNILKEIQRLEGIQFADAINLDGGSASVFITPEVKLSELAPLGSYFCF